MKHIKERSEAAGDSDAPSDQRTFYGLDVFRRFSSNVGKTQLSALQIFQTESASTLTVFFCKSGCAWERGSVREGQGRGRERWWGRYRLHLQPTGVGIPMQWRQRGGKRAGGEAGGGVKRRGVRWGRAHSVGTLSCGAPRILLTENPSVRSVKRPLSWTSRALCSSPWLTTPWSGCDKTLRGDETKKNKKQKLFSPWFATKVRCCSALFSSFSQACTQDRYSSWNDGRCARLVLILTCSCICSLIVKTIHRLIRF